MSEEIRLGRSSPSDNWRIISQSVYRPPPTPPLPTIEPNWKRPAMIYARDLLRVSYAEESLARQGLVLCQGRESETQTAADNYAAQVPLLPSAAPPVRAEIISGTVAFTDHFGLYWPPRGLPVGRFNGKHLLPTSNPGLMDIDFWDHPDALDRLVTGIGDRLRGAQLRGNHMLLLDNMRHKSGGPGAPPWKATIELLRRCQKAAHERGMLLGANMAAWLWNMTDAEVRELAAVTDFVQLEQWGPTDYPRAAFRKYRLFIAAGGHLAFTPQVRQPGVVGVFSKPDQARYAAALALCLGKTTVWGYINIGQEWLHWKPGAPTGDAIFISSGGKRAFTNGEAIVNYAGRTGSFIAATDSDDAGDG